MGKSKKKGIDSNDIKSLCLAMKDLTAKLTAISALEDDPASQGFTPVANRTRAGNTKKSGADNKQPIGEGATGGSSSNATHKQTFIENDDISSIQSWINNDKENTPRQQQQQADVGQADFIKKCLAYGQMGFLGQNTTGKQRSQPYYYIRREGIFDDRERFKARDSLTLQEYMLCYNNMLKDKNASYKGTMEQHLTHMSRIMEDSMYRPWHLIRRWSNRVFDDIDDGFLSWDEDFEIQNLRNRMVVGGIGGYGFQPSNEGISQNQGQNFSSQNSVFQNMGRGGIGGRPKNKPRALRVNNPNNLPETPCAIYNNTGQCEPTHHQENGVIYVHFCTHCYDHPGGGSFGDPAKECNRRRADLYSGQLAHQQTQERVSDNNQVKKFQFTSEHIPKN